MTQTPLLPAPPGVADVQAELAASRARRRRDSERIALLSVQLIAAQVRAALPEATTVGLSEADEDSSRFPDGYYTATGDEIGLTADGLQAASPELAALLLALTEAIRPWCTNLNDGNRPAWEPFTSDLDPKAGTRLDFWQLRLDIAGVLAAREGTRARCGCPAPARTTVGGVLLTGHQAGCGQAEPRQSSGSGKRQANWSPEPWPSTPRPSPPSTTTRSHHRASARSSAPGTPRTRSRPSRSPTSRTTTAAGRCGCRFQGSKSRPASGPADGPDLREPLAGPPARRAAKGSRVPRARKLLSGNM